ncbi:MAG: hypothetical protein K6C41_07360 [Lachnospiraceae bacterium]|nr:hypothetical protein [Lachnospiraceae bacterium]
MAINAVIFMGILTAAIATIGYKLYVDSVRESYSGYADTVLKYAYSEAEEYGFADDTLHTLQNAIKDKKQDSGTLEGFSTVYGHMLNGYHVVFDNQGNAAGLICVEIDTNRIYNNLHRYISWVILIAAVFTAIIVILYVLLTKHYLVGPIEKKVENSNSFVGKMRFGADPAELLNNVKNSVERFGEDAEQFDDFTMLCVEYYGK